MQKTYICCPVIGKETAYMHKQKRSALAVEALDKKINHVKNSWNGSQTTARKMILPKNGSNINFLNLLWEFWKMNNSKDLFCHSFYCSKRETIKYFGFQKMGLDEVTNRYYQANS